MNFKRVIGFLSAFTIALSTVPAVMAEGVVNSYDNDVFVHYSDDFEGYDNFSGRDIKKIIPGWHSLWQPSAVNATIKKDEDENSYVYANIGADRLYYQLPDDTATGVVKVSADIKLNKMSDADMYDFRFFFGEEQKEVRTRFYFNGNNLLSIYLTSPQTSSKAMTASNIIEPIKDKILNQWIKMEWTFDMDNQKASLSIGDVLCKTSTSHSGKFDMLITDDYLYRARFDIGTAGTGNYVSVDNFKITSDNDSNGVREFYQALKGEHLTNESKYAVTKDLDMTLSSAPEIMSLLDEKDLTLTFESSNTDVIANNGKVTRGADDEEVTITATVTDGTITRKKSFDYVVKSNEVDVLESQSYYYPDSKDKLVNNVADTGWKHYGSDRTFYARVHKDEHNEYSIMGDRTAKASSAKKIQYSIGEGLYRDASIEARFKFDYEDPSETQYYMVEFVGNCEIDGKTTETVLTEIRFGYGGEIRVHYCSEETRASTSSNFGTPKCRGLWQKLRVDLNAATQTLDLFVDDKQLNSNPIPFVNKFNIDDTKKMVSCKEITKVRAYAYRQNGTGRFYIDDFSISHNKGAFADATVYNVTDSNKEINGLELIEKNDEISAKSVFYNTEKFTEATMLAAVYNGQELHSLQIAPWEDEEGTNRIEHLFEDLDLPRDNLSDVRIKFFYWNNKNDIEPLCEPVVFKNLIKGNIEPQKVVDEGTGRTYYTMDFAGENAIRTYYTQPHWSLDGTKFYFHNDDLKLFEYNVVTGDYKYIDKIIRGMTFVTTKLGNLFYINPDKQIIKMTPDYNKVVVSDIPEEYKTNVFSLLQVNDDESRLSFEGYNSYSRVDEYIPVLNIKTGVWDLGERFSHETPTRIPDHINLSPNPEYGNYILFAHEGSGITDRIWVRNTDTNTYTPVFEQKMYSATIPAETVGHEGWSADGKKVLFCLNNNAGSRTRITLAGLITCDIDGLNRNYINNDYDYCHPSGSRINNRFAISDTSYNGKTTKLVLIDCYTGESHLLATLPQNGKDPGHTHPNFTWDGNTVVFGLYDENLQTVKVGWMDISDIVNSKSNMGGTFDLSASCDTTCYEGADNYVVKNSDGAFVATSGKHLNVNVKSSVVEKQNVKAEVKITYLDNGTEDIVMDYRQWVEGETNALNSLTETITRTGTNTYKTVTLSFDDIDLQNMMKLGTDFTLKGANDSQIAIKSVEVKEIQ